MNYELAMRTARRFTLLSIFLLVLACFTGAFTGAVAAQASVNYAAAGNAALNWAEANATGHWYVYGGTGPGYDCSGLVMTAFAHEGISLPHNTQAMINSGLLVRTYHPVRGDIAMWFSGGVAVHVGFVTIWRNTAYGALNYGVRIGWYSWSGWPPQAFYQVR